MPVIIFGFFLNAWSIKNLFLAFDVQKKSNLKKFKTLIGKSFRLMQATIPLFL
jgi:hypothetical protein